MDSTNTLKESKMRIRFQLLMLGLILVCGMTTTAFGQNYLNANYVSDPSQDHTLGNASQVCYNPGAYDSPGCINGSCGGCKSCSTFDWDRYFVRGWLQQGITIVPESPSSHMNTPMRFNDRSNDYQMHQLYLTLGRSALRSGCEWDWGFRVDVMYGTDYYMLTSIGLETKSKHYFQDRKANEPFEAEQRWNKNDGNRRGGTASMYGVAMPQLFAELYVPTAFGTNVKFGHFYSPMGSESCMAPSNFFYSRSYSMMFGGPRTFTGMMIDHRLNRNISAIFGLTQGWDAWDSPANTLSYLVGAKWSSWDRRNNLSFTLHTGETVNINGKHNRTNYSLAFSHMISPSLRYEIQHDLGFESNANYEVTSTGSRNELDGKWYSINQSLIWQLSQNFSIGTRFEWFKDTNLTRVYEYTNFANMPNLPYYTGGNYYQLTLGANWKPEIGCGYVTLRPEIRWDWTDVKDKSIGSGNKGYSVFNDGKDCQLITIGLDMIIAF